MSRTVTRESRRHFLTASAVASAGLIVGIVLPVRSAHSAALAAAASRFQPNAFIRITPDNIVTIIVGMSEMGQGVLTALPQLVAEELEADWRTVRFEQAPSDPVYANALQETQATGGSTSIEAFWEPMRTAGATAREMLIASAADIWKVDKSSCRAEKGWVVHASGRRMSYGRLAGRAATMPTPTNVILKARRDFTIIGKGERRLDSPAKVNGTALFGLDVHLPGMLVAVVARSPVIGGKVASFDGTRAKAITGVRHVLQLGSSIAVVADSYWTAKTARDVLDIAWDDGGNAGLSTATISKALSDLVDHPAVIARKEGDVTTARITKSLTAEYEVPYLAHACMEPMNCTAWVKPGSVEIWGPTQAPGDAQTQIGKRLGLDPKQVQVHTTFLGGGFGRRYAQDFVIDAVELSKAVGAPVQLVYSREDDIKGQFYRPAALARLAAGLDESGTPVSLLARTACSSIALVAGDPMKDGIDGSAVQGLKHWPYEISNIQVEWADYEPGITVWYMRSVGHSQNTFFVESFIDEMAHAAGKDPFDYRHALLSSKPRHRKVLELAAEMAGWRQPPSSGRARGIAVADFWGTHVAEVAEVSLSSDGRPRVHRVVCAVDCGVTVNPEIIKRQMKSAIIFALSSTLYGKITLKNGRVEQSNFHDYPILRINDAPEIEVHIVHSDEKPTGIGEPGTPPLAPAVVNALFALTGKRIRKLPLDPAELRT